MWINGSEPLIATVRVTEGDGDADALANATESLRLDILDLDVVHVKARAVAQDEVPDGARAGDPTSIGELVVTLSSSAEILRQLVTSVANWRRARKETRGGAVEVEIGDARITFTNPTAEQQDRLIDAFIKKVGG